MNLLKNKKLINKCKKVISYYRLCNFKERRGGVRRLRKQALKNIEKQVTSLIKQNYCEDIVLGILNKKSEIISQTSTEEGFCHLIPCSYPYFNGTAYVQSVPEEYYIPEEECVHWANFFACGQRSEAGRIRYDEVLALVFSDSDEYDINEMKMNNLKS